MREPLSLCHNFLAGFKVVNPDWSLAFSSLNLYLFPVFATPVSCLVDYLHFVVRGDIQRQCAVHIIIAFWNVNPSQVYCTPIDSAIGDAGLARIYGDRLTVPPYVIVNLLDINVNIRRSSPVSCQIHG